MINNSVVKISIIIPVYNVEKYIKPCFDSILSQSLQEFEVLIVDDGSTDSSGKICDEYMAHDLRFKVIHQTNQGIGNARNLAMTKMHGEYCFFLDPDDLLADNSLQYMHDLMVKHQADMVLGVSANFQRDEEIKPYTITPIETVYSSHGEIIEKVLFDKRDIKPLAHKREEMVVNYEFFSTLYRTKLFEEHNIKFLDTSYGEDTYLCFKSLICSKCVVTSSKPTYWHRRNTSSTSFRYHENYIAETMKYFNAYLGLFEELAPEYVERAKIGISSQCYSRALSALDRELLLAPAIRTTCQIKDTLKEIANFPYFRFFYPQAKGAISSRPLKVIALLVYYRRCLTAALLIKVFDKIRKK